MENKKQAIEAIAEEIVKIYCKSAGCENCDCAYEYGTKLSSCEDYVHYYQMAEKLYNIIYGNIKKAVTGFVECLKKKATWHDTETCDDDYYNLCVGLRDIDETLKELGYADIPE